LPEENYTILKNAVSASFKLDRANLFEQGGVGVRDACDNAAHCVITLLEILPDRITHVCRKSPTGINDPARVWALTTMLSDGTSTNLRVLMVDMN
jgi:hypothetical protein